MRNLRVIATVVSSLVVLAFAAAPSLAETVTLGSPLGADFSEGAINFTGPETFVNTVLPEPGALVKSPVEGTVVRWRVLGTTGGPFRLRVLSPNPDGTYTGAGTSSPQTSMTPDLHTFPTSLPIKAGQTIGIDNTHDIGTDKLGVIPLATAGLAEWNPALADGSARAPKLFIGEEKDGPLGGELGFNADIVPRPAVTLMSPVEGPITGGTAIAIAGEDLRGATSVRFGAAAAASFSVVSDGLVTAIAPAAAQGAVDVTVTTPGGTSAVVPADRFTYTACVVPTLTGKKLKAGRKKLSAADCKLGKIRGKGTKVVAQAPKPGSIVGPGSKVNVKLGAGQLNRRS